MLTKLVEALKNNKIASNVNAIENENTITFKSDILIGSNKSIEHRLSFNKNQITVEEAISIYVESINSFKTVGYYTQDDFNSFNETAKTI